MYEFVACFAGGEVLIADLLDHDLFVKSDVLLEEVSDERECSRKWCLTRFQGCTDTQTSLTLRSFSRSCTSAK